MEAVQLIEYLQGVAASLEAETGAPDPEIRGKIAQLQAVLAQRDTTLRAEASKLHAHEETARDDDDVDADAAIRQASHRMAAVESVLAQVEGDLAADVDAKRFLAQSADLWMPAIGASLHDDASNGSALLEGDGAEDMQQ
ncbi:hypothetical protein KFE25_002488 [Diacronema lutheri]|uniref:Uncharacterized protein n=1 Tax=Diacronema lutheri TaxID=2081491 RepID=A0A8J6C5B5_DIALT|nr:hypothetical protein KFE25_002488 [Diacronema lutheri]